MNAHDDALTFPIEQSDATWAAESCEPGLIERARTDPDAFAVLYRQHAPAIGTYLLRRTGDRHLTDDLVSETFLAAFRALGRFEARGVPLRAWLYRIATRALHRQARRSWWRSLARLDDVVEPAARVEPYDGGDEPAHARAALARLPLRYQDVASLFYLEELRVDQIAVVLGIREGTVKSRLHRARKRIMAAFNARR